MNITIERANPADAAAILAFLQQAGGESDNLTFGAEGLPFTAEAEAAYIAGMEDSRDAVMLVAKDGDRIIGNASLNRLPRRMSHRGDFGVMVLKDYWNQGVGGRLLQGILDFARRNAFELIDLQVRSDNLPAIHLYEKHGFCKLCTYPGFVKIGEERFDCDYMVLQLT